MSNLNLKEIIGFLTNDEKIKKTDVKNVDSELKEKAIRNYLKGLAYHPEEKLKDKDIETAKLSEETNNTENPSSKIQWLKDNLFNNKGEDSGSTED